MGGVLRPRAALLPISSIAVNGVMAHKWCRGHALGTPLLFPSHRIKKRDPGGLFRESGEVRGVLEAAAGRKGRHSRCGGSGAHLPLRSRLPVRAWHGAATLGRRLDSFSAYRWGLAAPPCGGPWGDESVAATCAPRPQQPPTPARAPFYSNSPPQSGSRTPSTLEPPGHPAGVPNVPGHLLPTSPGARTMQTTHPTKDGTSKEMHANANTIIRSSNHTTLTGAQQLGGGRRGGTAGESSKM